MKHDQAYVSRTEYMNIYRSHLGDLEEAVQRKEYIIKRNQADIIDLKERIISIKIARTRAEEEGNG